MANNKKSFLFYCDWIDTFKGLSKEKGYDLLIHILDYVNDENPTTEDETINGIFSIIRNQLKRDLKKYEVIRGKRSEAGKISANKRKQKQQVSTSVESVQQTSTNPTVKDIVIVKDIVKVINKRKREFLNSIQTYYPKYSVELLNDFYKYWTQHNPKGKKMKFEYAKFQPFHISYRLSTWLKNQKRFEKESFAKKEKKDSATIILEKYKIS